MVLLDALHFISEEKATISIVINKNTFTLEIFYGRGVNALSINNGGVETVETVLEHAANGGGHFLGIMSKGETGRDSQSYFPR